MTAKAKSAALCGNFSDRELEKTFFYPGPQNVGSPPGRFAQAAWNAAKEVCIECPLFLRCREERLGEEFGVWGGLDEHERFLMRRKMTRQRQAASEGRTAAEAARLYALVSGHRGMSPDEVARRTGVSLQVVKELVARHEELLAEQAPALKAPEEAPSAWTEKVVFPRGHPPMGDGWAWRDGQVFQAHYVAQTADGEHFFLKLRVNARPMRKWFPKRHVDLRAQVTPVIQEWAGRADAA